MAWSGISPISEDVDRVAHQTIGCAITVHRLLGPGFREHIYQQALCLELNEQVFASSARRLSLFPTSNGRFPDTALI